MPGFGSQFGKQFGGFPAPLVVPPVVDAVEIKPSTITIRTISHDLLRVNFAEVVATTPDLVKLFNYTITPLTSGASAVEPLEVRGVDFANTASTPFIDLHISNSDIGSIYQIVITNVRNVEGVLLGTDSDGLKGNFKGRLTKADAFFNTTARMFDLSIDSTLRHLFTALSLEDENMGGEEDLPALPSSSTISGPSTYGSSTYGTSTFGG